jgi:hypothetical protein
MAAVVAVAFGLFSVLVPAASASAAVDATGQVVDALGLPAAGVPLQINRAGLDYDDSFVTDASGYFTIPALDDDPGGYEVFIPEGTTGTGGERFSVGQRFFTVTAGVVGGLATPIVVDRYAPVSGTIANWSSTMGDVQATLYVNNGFGWQQININPPGYTTSTDGNFTISAPLRAASQYTLLFRVQSEDSPYLDAFLGGEFDDPALATHFTGVPNTGVTVPSMTLADAAVITGHVSSGGVALAGIEVEAENSDDYAYDETDSFGEYTLYVRPGSDYVVYTYGDALHAGMTFDGYDCSCTGYTPVTTSVLTPATDIDFDLLYSPEFDIEGVVAEDVAPAYLPVEGLAVKLYKLSVGGVWVLHDDFVSIPGAPNFGFTLTSTGEYRIQFVDAGGRVLMVVDGFTATGFGTPVDLDPAPACYAELGNLQDYTIVIALIDPATAAGICAALAAPIPPSGGGGTGTTKKPRGTTTTSFVAATPTPTPSATPTSSATPRPSASATPSATPVATDEPPASAPDLWWLLWVLLGVVVIVVVGGVVYFVRRT